MQSYDLVAFRHNTPLRQAKPLKDHYKFYFPFTSFLERAIENQRKWSFSLICNPHEDLRPLKGQKQQVPNEIRSQIIDKEPASAIVMDFFHYSMPCIFLSVMTNSLIFSGSGRTLATVSLCMHLFIQAENLGQWSSTLNPPNFSEATNQLVRPIAMMSTKPKASPP